MGSGLKAQNKTGIRVQRKGLRLSGMGPGITRLLSQNQGSDLLDGLKISYHDITVIITSWFAIALDEIRTRRILRDGRLQAVYRMTETAASRKQE